MAWRVIIEAVGDEVRLVHKSHADTIVPATPPTDTIGEGVVAELRDAHEQPLYRQDVSSQFERGIEVFSPEQIQRVDIPEHKRTMMLVLPEPPDARSLVFVRTRRRAVGRVQAEATSVEELGRIPLTDEK